MPKGMTSYLLYILITVLVVSLYVGDFTGLQKLQWKIDDLMYTFRGEKTSASDIVLVNIDDRSLEKMGPWPWSYDILADLVAVCNSGEPRSMLIDLDLSSRSSEDTSGNTQILANQVSWAKNIVITYDIVPADYSHLRMSRPEFLFNNAIQTESELGILDENAAINVRKPFLPSAIISQYADGLGFTYTEYEKDHRVRWTPLIANYEGYYYPSAALLVAALHTGHKIEDVRVDGGRAVTLERETITTDESGRLLINYNNPTSTFTFYSASELLTDRINLSNLKDKMVIIGLTAPGEAEFFRTPVASRMSRSEIYANIAENIIHGNYIKKLDLSFGLNILVLIGFGAFCAFILPRVTLLYRMIILFVCLFILVNLSFILFNSYSILTRSLYLTLELIMFMIVAPLVEDSSAGSLFSFIRLRMQTDGHGHTKDDNRDVPVIELRDTGDEPEFQATEHLSTPSTPAPSRTDTSAPQETAALDKNPPPDSFQEPHPIDQADVPLGKSSDVIDSADAPIIESGPSESPVSGPLSDSDGIKHLGRYQVVEIVGKGAMGTVFKGIDPVINRPVALKTIRLDIMSDKAEMDELRDRLSREARAAGKLSHPNIVTIYDIGVEGNLQYIAMEYLEGQTLENLIKKKVQFSYKIVANIITQICTALQFAHDQGIVHRDIKPANIMVLPDYSVKVMDFGIARVDSSSMTRTGVAMGTPNYIAPELLQGKTVDRRCDIFSLGVVIYELLTGRRPFRGENLTALIYSIINDVPAAPSSLNENVPLLFDHITARALQKNPLERFQKASDIKMALSDFVGSFSTPKVV